MRIFDRYILRQVGGVMLFGIALFTVMLTANHLFFLARFAQQQHLALAVLLRLVVLRLPYFVVFSLPMALLLGALLTVGRLSDHNEVVAMRTGGISLARLSLPVLLAGVFVAATAIALGEWVVPLADEQYAAAFRDAGGQAPASRRHILFRETEGAVTSVYYARRLAEDGKTLEGLVVNQFESDRLVRVIEAAQARFDSGQWDFRDGVVHLFTGPQAVEARFQRLKAGIRRTPREILNERKDPADMTIRELQAYIGVLRRTGESIARYLIWLHTRVALPASSIVFALLAIPLGLRPHRSGTSIGLGLTVLIVLLYYLLMSTMLALGESDRVPPIVAAWTPNLLLGGLGSLLLWRAQ